MLQALTRVFRRVSPNPDQLALDFNDAPPRDAAELLVRLKAMGMNTITRTTLTRNRNVMVSFGGGTLRVHEGYLVAPEAVLRAIVVFVEGRTGTERRAAKRAIVGFPIQVSDGARSRRERTHGADAGMAVQLAEWHRRYNARHFHGRLKAIEVRVSRRMKSRLGHYAVASPGAHAAEIAVSRSHLQRHGWTEALHTLLHEMVHQWQDETGRTIDHGASFRAKAREVGVAPYARRLLATRPGRADGSQTLGRRAARDG